ncbi:substrate-binding domain-containing protein [Sulfuriflexus sp.]|uniref:substrate-binding domain-containing protein n=1 Tax=Sulfuriflexus sp. TaxID=2015443 RepID=UPI0028CEF80E|nr:substrate-binding domain-containing protein [Sulfuriflexus sp.]MDT8404391.1 substrate-binding domain-containing protein [Sulfuriflexus sp.]
MFFCSQNCAQVRLAGLFCGLLLLSFHANSQELDNTVITGAGAHFSWVLFDALKPALEEHAGRPLKLFGEESMLGAGCNAGIKSARQDQSRNESFGFVCCPLSDKEIEKEQLRVFPLALEPILILTHKNNPISNLSAQQARDIFSGRVHNWRELGGPDQNIVVVTRLHCKQRPGHWKTILPEAKAFRQQRVNVKSAADMVDRVTDFPGAIGHTGSAWTFSPASRVKALSIDNHAPTAANLEKGLYPFYRQLSAVTSKNASPELLSLMTYAQELLAGHPVAEEYQLLPLAKGLSQ